MDKKGQSINIRTSTLPLLTQFLCEMQIGEFQREERQSCQGALLRVSGLAWKTSASSFVAAHRVPLVIRDTHAAFV